MEEQRKSENALVPALRFEGFSDPWEQRKLGEVAHRVIRKNEEGMSDLPLTISAQHGLVDQRDFFNSQVASRDMRGYYLLERGEFAYNKSTSSDSPWGAIKRLTEYEKGCLSTLYICFGLDEGDPDFLVTYYETSRWHRGIRMIAAEGARNHGLLNIAPGDFFETELTLPGKIEEQTAIGALFAKLDSLIALHQRKHEKLKTVKQSLLEKMFPKEGEDVPEIRFEGFTDPWEQRRLGEISESYSGGTPSVGNESYYGGDIPFIRSAEISSDSTELRLTEKGLDNSSAALVESGCVLYALYGATSGEVAISRIRGAINQAILAIVPSKNNNAEFIAAWLRREKPKILDTYLQGGQGNLSGAIVKDLTLALPSGEEQSRIGALFQKLDSLIALHQRELDILKNLKQALLEKMFV